MIFYKSCRGFKDELTTKRSTKPDSFSGTTYTKERGTMATKQTAQKRKRVYHQKGIRRIWGDTIDWIVKDRRLPQFHQSLKKIVVEQLRDTTLSADSEAEETCGARLAALDILIDWRGVTMDALLYAELTECERRVCDVVWRKTFLFSKFMDWIGEKQFHSYLGFTMGVDKETKQAYGRRYFYKVKKRLVERKILMKVERDGSTSYIGVNPNIYEWESRREGWNELVSKLGNRTNGQGSFAVGEVGE
jgi:hypothetical protein